MNINVVESGNATGFTFYTPPKGRTFRISVESDFPTSVFVVKRDAFDAYMRDGAEEFRYVKGSEMGTNHVVYVRMRNDWGLLVINETDRDCEFGWRVTRLD